jgi:hypothetical protein
MKHTVILALVMVCIGCNAQKKQDKNSIKKASMEKFDKTAFEANKVNGEYNTTLKDGTQVRQWETPPNQYVERIKKPHSPYETYKEFYYDNGMIKTSGELFYNFHINTWHQYDKKGAIIKEVNENAPYKFSIEDLNKMMLKMGVNIMVIKPGVLVNRFTQEKPLYGVIYPVDPATPYNTYELTIDGTTGKIIEKKNGEIKK